MRSSETVMSLEPSLDQVRRKMTPSCWWHVARTFPASFPDDGEDEDKDEVEVEVEVEVEDEDEDEPEGGNANAGIVHKMIFPKTVPLATSIWPVTAFTCIESPNWALISGQKHRLTRS